MVTLQFKKISLVYLCFNSKILTMKKSILFFFIIAFALASCQKEVAPSSSGEIVFNLQSDSIDMGVDTKATTAVNSLPASLYWGATSGTRGQSSEKQKWAAASSSVSSGKLNTGKYQTATATAYNYYVSNVSFTIPATGAATMTAENTTDIIFGYVAASSSLTPSITLNHIFARTKNFSCSTQSGYTISGVSWQIEGVGTTTGTKGTYNLATGAWSSTTALAKQSVTNSSDLYLIPGEYKIYVTYTLTKGDWTGTFTKSGNVTLVAGKTNNISCTAIGGTASEIVLSVSLTSWADQNLSLTLS